MVQTKIAMWWTWARIACHELSGAMKARTNGAPAWKFETESSASLSAEFEKSVTSIVAVAFALEAMSEELKAAGHVLVTPPIQSGKNVSKGYYVGHRLVQAFGFQGNLVQSLPSDLDRLFTMRNDAVHFKSTWRSGVHPHPSGTDAAYEITVYSMEEALR